MGRRRKKPEDVARECVVDQKDPSGFELMFINEFIGELVISVFCN